MKTFRGFSPFVAGAIRFWAVAICVKVCGLVLAVCLIGSNTGYANSNITFLGGPIMPNATVFLVYWPGGQPPPGGNAPGFDPSIPNTVGNYETLAQKFLPICRKRHT